MKRNKGFTILELIAIILVIALVLAISIPTVIGIIESTRKKAFSESARILIKSAVNLGADDDQIDLSEISAANIKEKLGVKNTNYSYVEMTKENTTNAVLLKLLIGKGQWDGLKACGTYRDMTVIDLNNQESCPSDDYTPNIEMPGVICGWTELGEKFTTEELLEAYDNNSICYIYSVEDLVGVSKLVNQERKSFENKTVLMVNNIDINNTATYYAQDSIYLGDVNNDGVIETLYQEMTTGKGFRPIGTSITNFQGTFEGNIKTISNLYINRPDQSEIGLFGYIGSKGKVRGLYLLDANITGNSSMGLLAGNNLGVITDSVVQGEIDSPLFHLDTEVFLPHSTIDASIGSVAGISYSGIIDGVLVKTSESVINYSYLQKLSGIPENSYLLNVDQFKGLIAIEDEIYRDYIPNDINFYESELDTWIGGDNNSDGYYFDYNNLGEVVLKKVADHPMTFNLIGSGTESNPYLINNVADWKTAALRHGSGYYFKLTDNIDFTDEKFYQLGSYYNIFNGYLDGNAKIISNIEVEGINYVGLSGYNRGTIKGLTINNIDIKGASYLGGIVGYYDPIGNEDEISDIKIISSIIGLKDDSSSSYRSSYLGGIVGYVDYGNILSILSESSIYSDSNYVGGFAGYVNGESVISGIISDGEISGAYKVGSLAGGIYYQNYSGTIYQGKIYGMAPYRYVKEYITYGASALNGDYITNVFDKSLNGDINVYDSFLDTWIGGDNNSNDYYFDYSESGEIIIKSVKTDPMTFDLAGTGTELDPYLINDLDDWKTMTLRPSLGYHFKLTNDLDFVDQKFYAMGSNKNYFSGNFNGDARYLKNINTKTAFYSGIFGYNNGTIKALNITNLNLIGSNYIGGVTGYNNGNINDINLQGNVKTPEIEIGGLQVYSGGLVGLNNSNKIINNVLLNINIQGGYVLGGIVGKDESGLISGVVEAGSLLNYINNYENCYSGKTIGRAYYNNGYLIYNNTFSSSAVTKNYIDPSPGDWFSDGVSFNSSNYNNLTSYNNYRLDTRIGGDNDSSGYYFDYNSNKNDIIVKSLEREPILNIYADAEEIEINYGDSEPITNYFDTEYYLHPTHNASNLVTTCRLERTNAVVTNINQIPLGRERVSCILSYTNEYGTTSSEPATTIFYHKLHIYANNADKVIDYGTATAIQNDFNNPYYSNPSSPLPGFSTVCRREKDSSSIGNTNQLPLGIDKVQCKLVFTNEYRTTNSEEASTTYKHQLYLSPKELQFSINYGQDSLISSYYNYNPELTGSDIVCRLGETVITNTNQLTTYGGNQVTCNRTYTNEYGSHSGPNSSILFTHYPPTIAAKATPTSVRYNLNNAILNYYDVDNKGYPGFTYTCRRARDNGVVTNINELAREINEVGIYEVACTISDANIPNYSTAQVLFKHWYYATNPTYSCPNGYEVSWDDPDGTREPVCRGIRASAADIAEICGDYRTGSDNVRSTELLGYRPSKGCYRPNPTGFAQFVTDLGIFNTTPTFGHGWNDQHAAGVIFSERSDESFGYDIDNCEEEFGYYMAEPIICTSWFRGDDPTTSGGTCNYNGTNDSGTTIYPTLSGGKCQFN